MVGRGKTAKKQKQDNATGVWGNGEKMTSEPLAHDAELFTSFGKESLGIVLRKRRDELK